MFIDGICGKLWERNNLTYFKMHQLTIPQQLALEQLNSMLIAYLGTALNSLRHLHSAWQRQRQRRPPCSQWGQVIYKGLGDVGCYINPSFSETSTFQLQNPVPFLTGKTGLYSDMFWTPLIAQALAIERKKDSEMARIPGVCFFFATRATASIFRQQHDSSFATLRLQIESYCSCCSSKTCS